MGWSLVERTIALDRGMSRMLLLKSDRSLYSKEVMPKLLITRAVLALVWAAALVVAIGDRVPTTHAELPFAAAALLATYPLIDAIASVVTGRRANAAISSAAAIAIGTTAFASDAAATLTAF